MRKSLLTTTSYRICRNSEIPPIGYRKASCPNQPIKRSPTHHEHVIDDFLGRGDLFIDVMPCEFGEFNKIEGWLRFLTEDRVNPCFPMFSSIGTSYRHGC